MTREEFNKLSFDEVMERLYEENDNITTIDMLKEFIKYKIDNDDFNVALHVLSAIWNDPAPYDSIWYDYDYSMGTLDKPTSLNTKEDIEHLIDD